MNSKITTNSQLSATESKKQTNELSKQLEQEQNHRIGGLSVGWRGENGGKGTGNKKHKWYLSLIHISEPTRQAS